MFYVVFWFVTTTRCNKTESRVAAYELITELANKSLSNLTDVCSQLIEMHHQPNIDCANEWEVITTVPCNS